MKERLLICDSSPSLGRILAQSFANIGIPADLCRNSSYAVNTALSSREYSCILFFAYSPEERLLDLISQTVKNGVSVFMGLYTSSPSVHRAFRNAGAAYTFIMPCSVKIMCKRIIMRIGNSDTLLSQIEIFLGETGFPRRLRGFACLASISTACIAAPERLWGGMSQLYCETAEKLSTEPSCVERAIRNLSSHAAENGSVSLLTEGRLAGKPTNTELICAVCDKFSRC